MQRAGLFVARYAWPNSQIGPVDDNGQPLLRRLQLTEIPRARKHRLAYEAHRMCICVYVCVYVSVCARVQCNFFQARFLNKIARFHRSAIPGTSCKVEHALWTIWRQRGNTFSETEKFSVKLTRKKKLSYFRGKVCFSFFTLLNYFATRVLVPRFVTRSYNARKLGARWKQRVKVWKRLCDVQTSERTLPVRGKAISH